STCATSLASSYSRSDIQPVCAASRHTSAESTTMQRLMMRRASGFTRLSEANRCQRLAADGADCTDSPGCRRSIGRPVEMGHEDPPEKCPASGGSSANRERGRARDRAHGKARLHADDARQACQMLAVDAFEIREVRHHDPQQVIVLPGHQVALHHFRNLPHGGLERRETGLALAVERDAYEDIDGIAGLLLV